MASKVKLMSRELNFEPVACPAPGEVVCMAHVFTPHAEHFDTYTMPFEEFRDMLKLWQTVCDCADALLISEGEMFQQLADRYKLK